MEIRFLNGRPARSADFALVVTVLIGLFMVWKQLTVELSQEGTNFVIFSAFLGLLFPR